MSESWTVHGITVDKLEAAEKMATATPEEAARVAEMMRADDKMTAMDAVNESVAEKPIK